MDKFCIVQSCGKRSCQLFPVPHKGSKVFGKWSKYMKLSETKRYLKPNAVPSLKIRPLISLKRKIYIERGNTAEQTPEHGYAKSFNYPRSSVMCSIKGCTAQAGNGIMLHKVPPPNANIFIKWARVLKSIHYPTKHTRVCSRHFLKSDYTAGGKRLRPGSFPTQFLTTSQALQMSNPYKRTFRSFKRLSKTSSNRDSDCYEGRTLVNSSPTYTKDSQSVTGNAPIENSLLTGHSTHSEIPVLDKQNYSTDVEFEEHLDPFLFKECSNSNYPNQIINADEPPVVNPYK
ncbi:uncharacterized protein LOC131676120 [Topomyia yanbarensis]|uniref:uncharacterized protein LOC131676120 n=1 Tax=Topomyia yanbarensis TaxID=2498891 RepID=UPI00273B001C|nr:uncharacterized protein LOC131676120 [Topomyia yanbarensis]